MTKPKDHQPAHVFHYDLQGKRDYKYEFLTENSLSTIDWNRLEPEAPNFFLVKKNFEGSGDYEKGFKMDELFVKYGMGITSGNDKLLVDFNMKKLKSTFENSNNIIPIYYRLFDTRYINYDTTQVERAREDLMRNLFGKDNLGLLSLKGVRNEITSKFGISKLITDKSVISTLDNGYIFPLYLYPNSSKQEVFDTAERKPNLNMEIVAQIGERLGLRFTNEKEIPNQVGNDDGGSFAPIDILDYIYAVLHSPSYREKYKEFLKIDFPRVPYPQDAARFWQLVKIGGEIRQIHLLENPVVEKYITKYPIDGDNKVVKPRFEPMRQTKGHAPLSNGRVYINETQYFDNVPEVAWSFYIGGYQPAQKWLKDRKERTLEFDDILHYQKIIVALSETARLMGEVDRVGVE